MLNLNALFSDGTINYRIPAEPQIGEVVTIRFRAPKENVDSISLITEQTNLKLEIATCSKRFHYYEGKLHLTEDAVSYYFEIKSGDFVCYYNQMGVVYEIQKAYNFIITPGFTTPDWMKGAVIYQIFVDRFCNGDESNDVEDQEYYYISGGTTKVRDWNKYPEADGVREFYGGDLKGVLNKLDYLSELGVEVIYLNPIFVSPSNHKYDIQDYDYIDPHFGVIEEDLGEVLPYNERSNRKATKYITRVTNRNNLEAGNRFFLQLVEEIHARGMKIILDGVFNHSGSYHKWMDREGIYDESKSYEKGAFIDKDSPYHSFYKFREDRWPNNSSYDGWWGHDTLPKLNYEGSEKLYELVMQIARKWVSPPFNCDGWRLDVAADLGFSNEFNHKFWKDFRKNVKEANPNAIILAEHYGDPSPWLRGDEWDSVMNYDAFMEPLTWFLTGMEKHSDEFRENVLNKSDVFFDSMRHHMARFQTSSLQCAMNELSNHDHSRFLTRTNHKVGRTSNMGPKAAEEYINRGVMRAAVTVQMTWPGAPTVYYGDEAGLCGWTDPDNRRTFPWGKEDLELIQLHKELIRIHKGYEALRTGSIKFLTALYGFISYGRFDFIDKFIVAVNNNNYELTVDINVWEIGIEENETLATLMTTTAEGHNPAAVLYHVQSGMLQLKMPPVSSIIMKNIVRL